MVWVVRIRTFPDFVFCFPRGKGNGQGVYSKLWTNGFLDSVHQGVQFSSGENPVLYLNDPDGMDRSERREMLDKLAILNEGTFSEFGDPEVVTKIQQYEMAFTNADFCTRSYRHE